jgi:N6-adenosine-specific RNA methylase IME4
MSEPLLKLIAAQRLLAETRELLEGEVLAASLRNEADRRTEAILPCKTATGGQAACRTNCLETLIDQGCRFGTIYADPPWHYANAASRGAAENHYRTMTIDAIAGLPIAKLAADQAHLHLWTTNAFLFEAQQVIEAWGFTYKSCLIWIKPQLGNGNYWRVSHEFLLLGVRGNLTFTDKTQQSWLCAERSRHSAKPKMFRKLIEQVSPGPRLELFARTLSDGWTTWGDQIQRDLFDDLEETPAP